MIPAAGRSAVPCRMSGMTPGTVTGIPCTFRMLLCAATTAHNSRSPNNSSIQPCIIAVRQHAADKTCGRVARTAGPDNPAPFSTLKARVRLFASSFPQTHEHSFICLIGRFLLPVKYPRAGCADYPTSYPAIPLCRCRMRTEKSGEARTMRKGKGIRHDRCH